jgi:hypothetical protein
VLRGREHSGEFLAEHSDEYSHQHRVPAAKPPSSGKYPGGLAGKVCWLCDPPRWPCTGRLSPGTTVTLTGALAPPGHHGHGNGGDDQGNDHGDGQGDGQGG